MKPEKILGLFSEKFKSKSVCESCGNEFTCGATLKGCWCMKVDLTDEIRNEMRSKFKDCLCADCLDKISAGGFI